MNEVAVHEPMDRAALNQLALAPTSRAANIIDKPRHLRAIAAVVLQTPCQLTADGARRSAQKLPDRPLAAAAVMLGKNNATFLSAEMGWLPPSPDDIAMCQGGGV